MSNVTKLHKVDFLVEHLGLDGKGVAYRLIREGYIPRGVVVLFGQSIRINETAFWEWAAKGGTSKAEACPSNDAPVPDEPGGEELQIVQTERPLTEWEGLPSGGFLRAPLPTCQ